MPYRADFIENNPINCEVLGQNIESEAKKNCWGQTSTRCHLYDYQQGIPLLLKSMDPSELGLVFVDPSGNPPNFKTLQYINRTRPHMEILIYISTTNVKRLYKYTSKKLDDHVASVGKNFWLIREPVSWDHFKWTYLLGTNTDIFKKYAKIGLHRLDSEEAQEIFRKLNLTEEERFNEIQPRLQGI